MMSHSEDVSVDRFEKILEGTSKFSNLEQGFQRYTKKVIVSQAIPRINVLESLKTFLLAVPKDNLHSYLDLYLNHVAHQRNLQWVHNLLDMLKMLVKDGQIPAKPVCDAAVKVLDVYNEMICCELLKLIKATIGGVDYKGCRDLLIILLSNVDRLPPELPLTCRKALTTVQQTVSYILDRNASILPAYVAGIELQKRYHSQDSKPHWVVAKEVEQCIDSLKGIANLISGAGHVKFLPVVGVSSLHGLTWKLDPGHMILQLKALLPYNKVYQEPHIRLLQHLLLQPQSCELVWNIGGFVKQPKNPRVEELLADLAVSCMKVSETSYNLGCDTKSKEFHMWNHFATQLFHFCFFYTVSFGPVMCQILDKILPLNITKGRDYLMWSIFQYLSSNSQTSLQINFSRDYPPVINLMDFLYTDKEPLPIPDIAKQSCVYKMAAASLWVYLTRKAATEKTILPRPTPFVLQPQVDYLNKLIQGQTNPSNYSAVLFCNAFSSVYEVSNTTLTMLAERCYGPVGVLSSLSEPCCTVGPTSALPLAMLDALTAHAKFSLINKLRQHIVKVMETPPSAETLKQCLPPALLEGYARFLSFREVEWIGFKTFLTQVVYPVVKAHSWHTLNALLELISFRVHQHIHSQAFRFKLLGNFAQVAGFPGIPIQLYISIETAVLRLIAGAATPDLHVQLAQYANDHKQLLSQDSEEFNKALVLTVAHTLHITGMDPTTDNWLEGFIKNVQASTPHMWSAVTQAHFPASMQHCYSAVTSGYNAAEHKRILITRIDEELRKWRNTANETELMRSYQDTDSSKYCLCVLWRSLMETGQVNHIFLRVMERISAKALAAQLRLLVDYIVHEVSNNPQLVNTAVIKLNELMWKYNLFPLDRLILTMCLRWFDSIDLQTCFKMIQMLILVPQEFRNRVISFLKECSPQHWEHEDNYQKHMAYLRQYPEKFSVASMNTFSHLPVYFGNVCLRFIPVLDLVIHRMLELLLELSNAAKSLETLLEHTSPLYKFHDHPITYLYITLHYYERLLADKHGLKKVLVSTILGAKKDLYPISNYLTTEFSQYLNSLDGSSFQFGVQHCTNLLHRLVEGLSGSAVFQEFGYDWRFSEFRSANNFVLYTTCVECLALPAPGNAIGSLLIEALLTRVINTLTTDEDNCWEWINSLAILLTNLPDSFRQSLLDQVQQTLKNDFYMSSSLSIGSIHQIAGSKLGCLMGLLHAYWQHSNIGTLTTVTQWIRSRIRPVLQTESQFIYFCNLVGPLFQRVHTEKPRLLVELVMEVYSLLQVVDQHNPYMTHADLICDLLYHIKYSYMGDANKEEIEKVVSNLQPTLQTRLRFLVSGSTDHPTIVTTTHL
ncbi:mediator of RNA polymerase II transcription subunit 23-like [Dysidea avara]|uniref:mediator of RNA polymerase II transcription subunit 23-like n=1 Tax=Dysidea avara TaxID=196820 RepID=UPI0033179E0F